MEASPARDSAGVQRGRGLEGADEEQAEKERRTRLRSEGTESGTRGQSIGAANKADAMRTSSTSRGGEAEGASSAFDRKIEAASAAMYFHYYGQLLHQQNMLQDHVRTGKILVEGLHEF